MMRVTSKHILRALEDAIIKCGPTLAEIHGLLSNMSNEEINTLMKYAVDEDTRIEYDTMKDNGEDVFDYEKRIFKNLNKTQRTNILENLMGFDEQNYPRDKEVGYPNDEREDMELAQEELQEAQGYTDEVKWAFTQWTNGNYDKIQEYVRYGTYPSSAFYDGYDIKKAGDIIRDYIQNSVGLGENTLMFRGGHWDIGMKVGEIGEIPCLNSLSYSRDSAFEIGIATEMDFEEVTLPNGDVTIEEIYPENRYMIEVYVDEGYKGAMVNAPSLAHRFPEHEYLVDKGSRYIVLGVDDENKTAKIKLLPPLEE